MRFRDSAIPCDASYSTTAVTMAQLPALNTPQFTWMKNYLLHKPQPVPPIFQPEIAADAIVWAAAKHPREVNAAAITSMSIWGDKLIPGLLDRYLTRTAFSGQQTPEPADEEQLINLWQPVDDLEEFGAHAAFDDRSRRVSWQWLAIRERGKVAAALGGLAAFGIASQLRPARQG